MLEGLDQFLATDSVELVLLAVKQETVMCDTLLGNRLPSFPSSLWAKCQLH